MPNPLLLPLKFGALAMSQHISHSKIVLGSGLQNRFYSFCAPYKVVKMIEYAESHLNPRYLLKCDDDSFVRLGHVLGELRLLGEEGESLYWGYFNGRAPVMAKVSSW